MRFFLVVSLLGVGFYFLDPVPPYHPRAVAAEQLVRALDDASEPPRLIAAAPVAETEPSAPSSTTEPQLSVDELVAQVGQVVSDWRTLGAVAGLIALINLLINLLRLPRLHAFLSTRRLRWLKPYLSAALGALLTGLSAYQTDSALLPAILSGLIFGLGAVGVHESIAPAYNPRKREQ